MHNEVATERLPDGTSFEMVKVEGGKFMMGSAADEKVQPVHEVQVVDFWMGKYLVTQDLWEAIMADNPSKIKGRNHPVDLVSWKDVQVFLKKLNQITVKQFRLPSESEWEFAARGGRKSQGFQFAGSNKLKEVAWYGANSHNETKPVGLKCPNELGLYDLNGNLFEWCADYWNDNYKVAPVNGSAWLEGRNPHLRVVRGGAYINNSTSCTVYHRFWEYVTPGLATVGFRLARS